MGKRATEPANAGEAKQREKMKTFLEMWEQAELADAACGGMDSIPEEEQEDYALASCMALWEDISYGRNKIEEKEVWGWCGFIKIIVKDLNGVAQLASPYLARTKKRKVKDGRK